MPSSTPTRKPASHPPRTRLPRGHRTSPRRSPTSSPGIVTLPTVIPEIVVGFDEEAVANAGIAALAACSELFTHGGQLVTLVPVPDLGAALPGATPALQIERLPTPRLRELLSRSARWLVPRSDDPAESALSHVPSWAVSGIAARREWPGLRPLTALVKAPVLRPDGTVLESPGYDPVTGLYLAPHAPHPRVPEHPTQADARAAAEVLLASVRHIPFATPVDRAAWLAMALTTPARFAVGAASPLCIIEDGAKSWWAEEVIADLAVVVGAAPLAVVDVDDLLPSPRRPFDALRATGEPVARITNGAAMGWRRIHEALLRARATVGVVWFGAGWSMRYLIRNHQKMAIADDARVLIGGFNVSDAYFGLPGDNCWHDLGLSMAGPDIAPLVRWYALLWQWTTGRRRSYRRLRALIRIWRPGEGAFRWLVGGPTHRLSPWARIVRADLDVARRVDMIAAYFSPGRRMLRRLSRVGLRAQGPGEGARLILASKSDNTTTNDNHFFWNLSQA